MVLAPPAPLALGKVLGRRRKRGDCSVQTPAVSLKVMVWGEVVAFFKIKMGCFPTKSDTLHPSTRGGPSPSENHVTPLSRKHHALWINGADDHMHSPHGPAVPSQMLKSKTMDMFRKVQSVMSHNYPKLETTQMFIISKMDKEIGSIITIINKQLDK